MRIGRTSVASFHAPPSQLLCDRRERFVTGKKCVHFRIDLPQHELAASTSTKIPLNLPIPGILARCGEPCVKFVLLVFWELFDFRFDFCERHTSKILYSSGRTLPFAVGSDTPNSFAIVGAMSMFETVPNAAPLLTPRPLAMKIGFMSESLAR